jgi:hypothetical protein
MFAPHIRITALGRLGAAASERFSFGLNMHRPADDGVPALGANQTVWDDVAADFRAYFSRVATAISNNAVLEEVKVASIGANGRYVSDPIIVNVADVGGGGGDGSNIVIPQSAMCVSFGTARRGSSGRGRMYLPMPAVVLDFGSLLVSPAAALGIRDSSATLIENLNNQPGIDVLGLQCCVASSKGFNSTITSVRVGRVVDTMRSRRRSLLENYTVPAAIAPA